MGCCGGDFGNNGGTNCTRYFKIGVNTFTVCHDEVGNVIGVYDEDGNNILTDTIINREGNNNNYIINDKGDTASANEITEGIHNFILHGDSGNENLIIKNDPSGIEFHKASNVHPVAKRFVSDDIEIIGQRLHPTGNGAPRFFLNLSKTVDNNGKKRTDWPEYVDIDITKYSELLNMFVGPTVISGIKIKKSGWYEITAKAEVYVSGAVAGMRVIIFSSNPEKNVITDLKVYESGDTNGAMSLDSHYTFNGTDGDIEGHHPRVGHFTGSDVVYLKAGDKVWMGGRVDSRVYQVNDDVDDAHTHTHTAVSSDDSYGKTIYTTVNAYSDPDGESTLPSKFKLFFRKAGFPFIKETPKEGLEGGYVDNGESGTNFTVKWLGNERGGSSYQQNF